MEHLTLDLEYLPYTKKNGDTYHPIRRDGKHTGNVIFRWLIKGSKENKTLLQMSNSKWIEHMTVNGKTETIWLTYYRSEHSYMDLLAKHINPYNKVALLHMLDKTTPQLKMISFDNGKTWKTYWSFDEQ